MVGWMACDFTSFLTVPQSLQDDERIEMKGYVLWNPVTIKRCLPTTGLKSRKENPQKLPQLSSRSHPRHLVGKRTAQKDTIIDITSDSRVNRNFPNPIPLDKVSQRLTY